MNLRNIIILLIAGLSGWLLQKILKGDSPRKPIKNSEPSPSLLQRMVRTKTVITQKFVINGVTYNSVEDVPVEYRERLKETLRDENKDGIPDIFQKK